VPFRVRVLSPQRSTPFHARFFAFSGPPQFQNQPSGEKEKEEPDESIEFSSKKQLQISHRIPAGLVCPSTERAGGPSDRDQGSRRKVKYN
jgi:hypothetical protein